jgi:hypothetical protein
MDEPEFFGGHKTMLDGSRVELTASEASDFWDAVNQSDAERAESMPTVRDALGALSKARQRLRDLGWRKGGGLEFRKEGEPDTRNDIEWAVIEEGSTGIFYARRCDKYFHYCDCVSAHQKVYAKKASDLTEDEREWADQCQKEHNEYMDGFHNRMAEQCQQEDTP